MNIRVERVWPEQFNLVAKDIHFGTFGEERDPDKNRIDFALLCVNEHDKITAYSTLVELDDESVYMQHGGSVEGTKFETVKSYLQMIADLKSKYKHISTRVFNYNIPMIKLALQAGFIIVGAQYNCSNVGAKNSCFLLLELDTETLKEN